MSAIAGFKRALSTLFRMEDSLDIVARWDIPFSEASRISVEGKLPTVSITFPFDDDARCLSTWESIYLTSLRYQDVTLMIRSYENKAAYELILVRHKK